MNASASTVVFTCEHGGNGVPGEYAAVFRSQRAQQQLRSHVGYDIGALDLARQLATAFEAPLLIATVTRLLIDLNRVATNPSAFSAFSRRLPASVRQRLIDEIHVPYRTRVVDVLRKALVSELHVYHVAVHSFTPRWRGAERMVDIGLLYDPSRSSERKLCAAWKDELRAAWPELRVRRNFPYRGTTDGMPTWLRRTLDATRYSGVELEVNQRLLRSASTDVAHVLSISLSRCLDRLFGPDQRTEASLRTSAEAVSRPSAK
jgi:predicted N-formylglutamate amidohydrolase